MSKVIADQFGEEDSVIKLNKMISLALKRLLGPLQKSFGYCTHNQEEETEKIETPLQGETVEDVLPSWIGRLCYNM